MEFKSLISVEVGSGVCRNFPVRSTKSNTWSLARYLYELCETVNRNVLCWRYVRPTSYLKHPKLSQSDLPRVQLKTQVEKAVWIKLKNFYMKQLFISSNFQVIPRKAKNRCKNVVFLGYTQKVWIWENLAVVRIVTQSKNSLQKCRVSRLYWRSLNLRKISICQNRSKLKILVVTELNKSVSGQGVFIMCIFFLFETLMLLSLDRS